METGILTVFDNSSGFEVSAESVLSGNESRFSFERMTNATRIHTGDTSKYSCGWCNVSLTLKTSCLGNRFFSHFADSDDCPWKSDINTSAPNDLTTPEGELHKFWKAKLSYYLSITGGVTNIAIEKNVTSPDGAFRRPDVQCCYIGKKIAFEVQVSNLSPEVIIAREKFYENIDWELVWLLPSDKINIIHFDLVNNPNSKSFYAVLDSGWLKSCERRNLLVLIYPIWTPDILNSKVSNKYTYETYSLEDITLHVCENSFPKPEDEILAKGSVKFMREIATEKLLYLLSCPDSYAPLSQRTVQDIALDDYFKQQLNFTAPLKNAVRLIGGIKIGKSLWETPSPFIDILIEKLLTQKYSRYLPAAIAAIFAYRPSILNYFEISDMVVEYSESEDFYDIEDPFQCISGKGADYLLAMFPQLEKFWDGRLLNEEINQFLRDSA